MNNNNTLGYEHLQHFHRSKSSQNRWIKYLPQFSSDHDCATCDMNKLIHERVFHQWKVSPTRRCSCSATHPVSSFVKGFHTYRIDFNYKHKIMLTIWTIHYIWRTHFSEESLFTVATSCWVQINRRTTTHRFPYFSLLHFTPCNAHSSHVTLYMSGMHSYPALRYGQDKNK